jgi:hypothetical protein
VSRVNVSLDTLDRDCMKGITGRDCLPSVLAGLQAAKAAGLRLSKSIWWPCAASTMPRSMPWPHSA